MIKLFSSAFKDGQRIPNKYSHRLANVNPTLNIIDTPEGTNSLVIIVHDPDAPIGDYTHWIVWNIEPSCAEIEEKFKPKKAIVGVNDFGNNKWYGPAPPSGTHRYIFELFALDKELSLSNEASNSELRVAMDGHVIDSTTLIGLYSA